MSRVVASLVLCAVCILLALLRKYRTHVVSNPALKYSYYPALILLAALGINYLLTALGANNSTSCNRPSMGSRLGASTLS